MNCRFFVILMVCALLVGQSPVWAKKRSKKKDKTEQAEAANSPVSKFKKTLSKEKGCVTAQAPFPILHKVGGKLYIEIPRMDLATN